MKEDLKERILSVTNHILKTHDTIRGTALLYGYSKSTVHNDVSIRLQKLDYNLYTRAKKILDENFAEKHIRGGEATKKKYLEEREQCQ